MSKVNNLLWDSVEDHQFITAVYGILDCTNRTFVFSNAGHNPLMIIRADDAIEFVEFGDLPLGMFRDARYHQHFARFRQSGEILVIYTDGITEATNESGEEYGKERFAGCILECKTKAKNDDSYEGRRKIYPKQIPGRDGKFIVKQSEKKAELPIARSPSASFS